MRHHGRIKMAELAERTSDFIMVDPWEAVQPSYTPTAKVLDHFDREINDVLGGVEMASGEGRRRVRIVLLAGADLIETMVSLDSMQPALSRAW